MCTSRSEKEYSLCFLFLKVWEGENWKRSTIIHKISYHFVASDKFYQLCKNYAYFVRNKYISLRHWVKIYEFFIVFEKCDREEFFKAVYLFL